MKEKEISFEENLKNLETIVQELENGNLNLEDSVKKFEEGIKISKNCNELLENAEKKINILVSKNGQYEEESFIAEELIYKTLQ